MLSTLSLGHSSGLSQSKSNKPSSLAQRRHFLPTSCSLFKAKRQQSQLSSLHTTNTNNKKPTTVTTTAVAGEWSDTSTTSPYEVQPGTMAPLGPSPGSSEAPGVNFAVYAPAATSVSLCLFASPDAPILEARMHKQQGDDGVWHAFVPNLPYKGILYGYRVNGNGGWETPYRWSPEKVLLDPYAKFVAGRKKFGVRDAAEKFVPQVGSQFLGTFDFTAQPFDWGSNYSKPSIPFQDLVICELPIRCFTADPSSKVEETNRGTFLGLIDKIPHLLETGVNAIELLPVFEYDELEFQIKPNPRDHMVNVWGYSHINFFAPMSRFAANGGGPFAAATEFKQMVKALHAAGIEIILDVVYNHTAEADDKNPYPISWRGIDSGIYYQQDLTAKPGQRLLNYSGCGNTVAGNNPIVLQQIMDSLKYWVEEYHVDGFRFDLASCLCRDQDGTALSAPPLIRAISKDPVLKDAKLIAEPWDIGMYQVGSFPAWDRWAEWNGKYRDDIRKFIRGDTGMKPAFATRIAGSEDLYASSNRKPYHSINFIIAHDGFTLYDLCAYNEKHNEANGENNCDGTNDNFGWNCGEEGETSNAVVLAVRARQMRNLHLALMLSQGTPMVLAGDEFAFSHQGNNNWYGHDTSLTHYQWTDLDKAKQSGWFRFYSGLIKMRRECPLLGRETFLNSNDVTWHEDSWDDPESRFLAFTLHDSIGSGYGDLYAAFNAHSFEVRVKLPPPPAGKKWCRIVDTSLPTPRDYVEGGNAGVESVYGVQAHTSILLIAKDA